MKRGILIYILFQFCFTTSFTQDVPSDTIQKERFLFPKQYGEKKWKFLIGLDARRSFLRNAPVKINGLKIGAEYKGVHRFGLGLYFLNSNVLFPDITVNELDAASNPEVQFNLSYSSLFYERIFLKTRWWEVALPVHLGGGSIRGFYRDTAQTYRPLLTEPFSALLTSAQVKFYPLTWLAVRVSGGYRFNFNTSPAVKQSFNNAFYGFGLSVNLLGMYRAIFGSKEERSIKKERRKQEIKT